MASNQPKLQAFDFIGILWNAYFSRGKIPRRALQLHLWNLRHGTWNDVFETGSGSFRLFFALKQALYMQFEEFLVVSREQLPQKRSSNLPGAGASRSPWFSSRCSRCHPSKCGSQLLPSDTLGTPLVSRWFRPISYRQVTCKACQCRARRCFFWISWPFLVPRICLLVIPRGNCVSHLKHPAT